MTHMAHMDETYLHLVTSLLMEKDTLFRADRSDSMTSEDRDDFLPLVSEFLIPQRDRAFSWDVSFEEGLSGEATQALIAEQTRVPFYYKPMLPPTTVSTKLSTSLKIPAIVEEDFTLKFLTDVTAKKETLPIKKRKIPESKSDSAVKKSKVEKNEKTADNSATKLVVPSEGDFAKNFTKRADTVSAGNKMQSPAVPTSAETKAATAKKAPVPLKVEEKAILKPEVNPSNIRLPAVPTSLALLTPKGVGLVTPVATSPSSVPPGQMLLPQPTWNDYGVYQPADMARATSTMGSNIGLINGGLQMNMNLSRIPLLASDFGPANGIVIGDGCRVGVYTREERLVRIERFREKKLKRIWRKQIKYDCRKRLADTRPRVKGRFVSRIGENGEELPPEPKPDADSIDGKKKKKKLPKACMGGSTQAKVYAPYALPMSHMSSEGANGGDTTQESEEGEDAGDSICSDAGDSLSMTLGGEMMRQDHDGDMQISLEDSLGHIIDIICGDDHDGDMN